MVVGLIATLVLSLMSAIALPTAASAREVPLGEIAADYARNNLVGKTYSYGGRSTSSFDCSGSVYLAWNHARSGLVSSSSSKNQYNGTGTKIAIGSGSSLLPGDLVFWSSNGSASQIYHVAIYLGNGEVLQTSSSRRSWIGSVNDDKSNRMTHALRPSSATVKVGPFKDVPAGHKFEAGIRWASENGITTGYSDGTFRPGESVARDAAATMIYRLEGRPSYTPPASSRFTDVPKSAQFYKEIHWIAAKGITTGHADGSFKPKDTLSREALAVFMYRLAGRPAYTAPSSSRYSDLKPGDKFYREIHWAESKGVMGAYSGSKFEPKIAVSRQAFVTVLHRMDQKGY